MDEFDAFDINDSDEDSEDDSEDSHSSRRSSMESDFDFCTPGLRRRPGGYDEYVQAIRLVYSKQRLAELAERIDIAACKAFFEECAALKRKPHPLVRLRREDYPVYRVPLDHPDIPWDKLTFKEKAKLRGFNLLDFDQRLEIIRRSPVSLIEPLARLQQLQLKKNEQGYLNTSQQFERVGNKFREAWAVVKTFKTEITQFDWALLNSAYFVQPMHSRGSLYWPDGDSVARNAYGRDYHS